MNQFVAFIKKEFHHIFRDRRTLLIILGIPVVQMLLFGFALNMEVQNIRTAVLDLSNYASTIEISRKIEANPYFNIVAYPYSIDEVNDLLRRGKLDLAVVYESNFHNNLIKNRRASIQLIADTSDPNRGTIATNYATAIIMDYNRSLMGAYDIAIGINPQTRMLFNPEMKSAFMFVPGIMGLILMIICSMMTAVSIVREKEYGTMEMLTVSPLKPITMISAKTVPYMFLSQINVATILLLSYFVLGVPIRGSLILLLSVCLLYILLSLSLGILISTVVKKQMEAVIVCGIGLMMPLLILSDMIFPIDNMPIVLQWFSTVVPARWFITAVKKIMIEGQGLGMVYTEIVIMILMFTVLTTASLINLKKRLQ